VAALFMAGLQMKTLDRLGLNDDDAMLHHLCL
jgi:hypothetical protein